jgi:hypothetical protein
MSAQEQTLTERRLAKAAAPSALIEQVLIKGDLANLTPDERNAYYLRVCESAGLNPLTKPLEYIKLNGKLVLYALRSCTDQLRAIHGVSVVDMDNEDRDGVHIVTVKVTDKHGRSDMARGAVSVGGLKGEALANAIMKAETKAKRRATLSICGLGLLDETEVETIPGAAAIAPEAAGGDADPATPPPRQQQKILNPETGRMIDPNNARNSRAKWERFCERVRGFTDLDELEAWWADASTQAAIDQMPWAAEAAEEYEKAQERLINAGRP